MTFGQALLYLGYVAAAYAILGVATAMAEGRRLWHDHYMSDKDIERGMGDSGVMYLGGDVVVILAVAGGAIWPFVWRRRWKERKQPKVWRPLNFFSRPTDAIRPR